jgi:hypothetical protein
MRHLDQPSSRVRWADAAAVLAVVVTVILTARQLRPLAETAAFLVRTGDPVTALPAATWPRAAAWVAISVAVLARWRTAAALGAWAAVLYEIVVVAMRVNGDPGYGGPFNVLVWPLLLAVAAALLLSVSAPVGRGLDLLGRRGRWLLAVAAAATTLTATAIPLLGDYHGPARADGVDAGFNAVFVVSSRLADAVGALTFAAVLALAAVAVLGVDRAVRRRVLALAAAGAAGFVAIQLGLPLPFGVSSVPVLSGPTRVALLVLGPGLALGVGLVLIRFSERPPPTSPTA